MGKVNRIISNTYNIFVLDILIKVISASFMIYAARVLGVKYFGAFILIVTVVNLYNIFSVLGIRPMAIREIAKSKDNAGKFLNNILGLRLILALIAYTVLIIFVSLVDYHPEVKIPLCILALTLFVDVFSGTFSFVYIAYERMKILRQFSVIMSFLSTGTSFLLLYLGYGVMALVLNAVFFSIVSAVIYGWHIWVRFFPFRIEANLTVWRWILLESLPFALYGIINMITLRGGIFLLSIIKGPVASTEAIGYYSPANSILNPAIKLPHSMRIALLPIIAENMDSTELMRKIVERTTKYLLIFLSFPIILITTFFPESIVLLFLGKEYLPVASVLRILGWAFAFRVINAPVISVLASSKQIYRYLPLQCGITIMTLTLSIVLIPKYSFMGLAIAELVGDFVATLTRHYLVRIIYGANPGEQSRLIKIFLTMVSSLLLIYLLYHQGNIPIFLSIFLGLIVYGVMINTLDIFERKELTILFRSFLKSSPIKA